MSWVYALPEHLSSFPVFGGVHVTRSLVLCTCFVYRYLSFCPFVAIMLSVFHRFTDSDYPFGIFNSSYHLMHLFFLSQKVISSTVLLTPKLLKQCYLVPRLKSSLQNLYGRHHDLVDSYEISTLDLLLFT